MGTVRGGLGGESGQNHSTNRIRIVRKTLAAQKSYRRGQNARLSLVQLRGSFGLNKAFTRCYHTSIRIAGSQVGSCVFA